MSNEDSLHADIRLSSFFDLHNDDEVLDFNRLLKTFGSMLSRAARLDKCWQLRIPERKRLPTSPQICDSLNGKTDLRRADLFTKKTKNSHFASQLLDMGTLATVSKGNK